MMALTEQEVIEAESFWCEYCCNFDKEHRGMDGMALCKITNTLAYSEESGKDCPFFNKPKSRYIELPCAVGDTVYFPWEYDGQSGIAHNEVESIKIYCNNFLIIVVEDWESDMPMPISFSVQDFGKTVFLTKEEAEKALENKQ